MYVLLSLRLYIIHITLTRFLTSSAEFRTMLFVSFACYCKLSYRLTDISSKYKKRAYVYNLGNAFWINEKRACKLIGILWNVDDCKSFISDLFTIRSYSFYMHVSEVCADTSLLFWYKSTECAVTVLENLVKMKKKKKKTNELFKTGTSRLLIGLLEGNPFFI